MKEACIASCDEKVRELFYDMLVLFIQLEDTSQEEPLRYELINTLTKERNVLVKKQLEKRGTDSAFSLMAIGHAI